MTLQQLEYILALNEHGNFTKAAEACGVTQPTLSTMIQRLEQELAVPLFDRIKQPIEPTDIGRSVIRQARTILGEASKVKEIIDEASQSITGSFTMSFLPTISPFLVPLVLPKMVETFSEAQVNIKEAKTSDTLNALINREIDLAVIATEPEHHMLQSTLLYYEEFIGYVPKGPKYWDNRILHSSDINAEDLWLLDEGHCFRDQLIRFCKLKDEAKHHLSYSKGSLFGFMHLVEKGFGLTIIPHLAVHYLSEEQKQHCRSFAVPRPTRGIYLVWNNDFVRHSIIKKVTEIIQSAVPKEMLELGSEQNLAK